MDKVDITLPVLLDNAVIEYEKTSQDIAEKYGIPMNLVEIALEKALYAMKERRLHLYASALYDSNASGKETIPYPATKGEEYGNSKSAREAS